MSTRMQRTRNAGWGVLLLVAMLEMVGAQPPGGQDLGGNIKYNAGQSIQPIFDGWTKNADGSYSLHFGYLNRNYVEELHVPIGPANDIEPGGPDRGQPTHFYTRFNKRAFTVTVPGDWGKKEVVWTVTGHGKTQRAIGWLQPEWEIEPNTGAIDASVKNEPPALTLAAASRVTLPARLTLTATITDDGQPPTPRGRRGGNSENPPAFHFPQPTPSAPANVPQLERPPRLRITDRLRLTWIVWRGPAAVTFDPAISGADSGKVMATATFTSPGDYVLRARASDPAASTVRDVRVTVDGPTLQ